MKKHIKFPSIERFENFAKTIKHSISYKDKDEEGNPIYHENIIYPTLYPVLVEKVHGTNAAVCYNKEDGLWVQSKNNIVTPEKDNYGCAKWVEDKKDIWIDLIKNIANTYSLNLSTITLTIYFEFAGKSIQQKSCVPQLEKSAFIFPFFRITDNQDTDKWMLVKVEKEGVLQRLNTLNYAIYNIIEFSSESTVLDLNDIKSYNELLEEKVKTIEKHSSIGTELSQKDAIGEGLVGYIYQNNGELLMFKAKGEAHTKTKKKQSKYSKELLNKLTQIAEQLTPVWRLEQAVNEVTSNPIIQNMGNIIKWVVQDIEKEEQHTLNENNITIKDISSFVSKITANWYKEYLKDL